MGTYFQRRKAAAVALLDKEAYEEDEQTRGEEKKAVVDELAAFEARLEMTKPTKSMVR
jgi:hypothetical protein